MQEFVWWSREQKKLMEEVRSFADENLSQGEEVSWTKVFPKDLVKEVVNHGWFGALIPEEYGGLGTGVTGCCIVAEQLSRVCMALAGACSVTMYGGTEQLLEFGTSDQKERWLPKIAKGAIGAICITEPGVGSDAASIETTAKRDRGEYVLNGKKRFITNAGLADIYLVYAKTSDRPKDRAGRKHLSSFLVEKGAAGFTVERINELGGWPGLPNGYLDFDDVQIPVENRIGEEGDGWKILVEGLNFERTLFSAEKLGPMKEALRYAVGHAQRRIQFGKPTVDWEVNQFKIADMIAKYLIARLSVYHAAHLLDLKADALFESTLAKLYIPEAYERILTDSAQVMGGDGWTRFYPVESFLRDAKVNHIGAGTSEVMKIVIYRQAMRALKDELRMPCRQVHPKLGVPISTVEPTKMTELNEETLLETLAEDYRVNPGLYMNRNDMKRRFVSASDDQLDEALSALENEDLVKLYRDRQDNIALAKATNKGLKKARPLTHYKWFPEWMREEYVF